MAGEQARIGQIDLSEQDSEGEDFTPEEIVALQPLAEAGVYTFIVKWLKSGLPLGQWQSIKYLLNSETGVATRTLCNLIWITIILQFLCLVIAKLVFNLPIVMEVSLGSIVFLILLNIYFHLGFRRLGKPLEGQALGMQFFTFLQFLALIGFNGGLANPFSIFLLLPLLIAASTLTRYSSLILSGLAVFGTIVVFMYHAPLPMPATMGSDYKFPFGYEQMMLLVLLAAQIIIPTYIWVTSDDSRRLNSALGEATKALAHERELSALGAMAAATAHELGSPLSTITLITHELIKAKRPLNLADLDEDIRLLHEQAVRCRDVLTRFAKRPQAARDDAYQTISLTSLLEELGQRHVASRTQFRLEIMPEARGMEPVIFRQAELLNGIGNLLSNASQFAKTHVLLKVFWDWQDVQLVIHDDGPGFPQHIIERAGEPYISTRHGSDGHMGLGLFIAVTLLERLKAKLRFRNRKGAEVTLSWKRTDLEALEQNN